MSVRRLAIAPTLAVLTMLGGPIYAADDTDHPLISRYPGSEVTSKSASDFDKFKLIVGLEGQDGFAVKEVEGTITRIGYSNPRDRSTLEIYRNYEQALKGAGFEELWSCADKECGPAFASSRWNRFNGTINIGSDSRYLAGRIKKGDGEAFVALAINKNNSQITVVEVQAMEEGLVTVSADMLGNSIDDHGRAIVPGIFFDTDKAVLKPDSAASLQEMAKLLNARPKLNVWIVGHTDSTGGFDHNMQLSTQRARAVAKALVEQHGIKASRLEGYGVGPLSPTGANTNEGGRSDNRRVELVARP